jgi:hypothetical protein
MRFYSHECLGEEVSPTSYTGSRYGHKGGARVRRRAVGRAARRVYGGGGIGWSARRAWTRGVSRVGKKGGGHGGSTAHGAADNGRPRRAGPAESRRGDARRRRGRALWSARVPTHFSIASFDRVLL